LFNELFELELMVIELVDGSGLLCMKMCLVLFGFDGVVDISDSGGWCVYFDG